jgi:hypothetical protein
VIKYCHQDGTPFHRDKEIGQEPRGYQLALELVYVPGRFFRLLVGFGCGATDEPVSLDGHFVSGERGANLLNLPPGG